MDNTEGLFLSSVPNYAKNNHWLNILQIDTNRYGNDREGVMRKLEENEIQTRPVWALNHLQKPYRNCQHYKIKNAISLVEKSLCLPSSSNLANENLNKIIGLLSE